MIVIRKEERVYAARALHVVSGLKKVSNGVSVGAKNLIKKKGTKLIPKSTIQINRETIGLKNKVLDNASRAIFDTGKVVDKGVRASIANPIAAAGQLPVGEVLMAVNPAVGAPVMAAPTGALSLMAEKAVKKVAPGYKRAVENAAEKYARSGTSKSIQKMPSLYRMATKTSKFMGEMGPAFGL